MSNFKLERFTSEYIGLAWKFHVSPSSCDNPDLYETYLRCSAISEGNAGMGTTHIVLDRDANKIAGYITWRASSLISENSSGIKIVNPALEIAMLAVDRDYERQKIGTALIKQTVATAEKIRTKLLGIRHIVVCPAPYSIGFYKKTKMFKPLNAIFEVLHDGNNDGCVPYFMTLPEHK